MRLSRIAALTVLMLLVSGGVGHASETGPGDTADAATWKGDPFPLENCPSTGYRIGLMGEPTIIGDRGREVRLCCDVCRLEINSKPDEYHEKMDRQIIEDQRPYYPLETYIFTGKPLDSGGGPVDFVYKNRLFRFHSEACREVFLKDPLPYVQKHERAVEKLARGARREPGICPVSKMKLADAEAPVSFVMGQQWIELCCGRCRAEVEADPWTYLEYYRKGAPRDAEKTGALK